MLKICGAVLIIISSLLLGAEHSKLGEKRINILDKQLLFFAKMIEKVNYDLCDLGTAMHEAAGMAEDDFAKGINAITEEIKSQKYESFFDAWNAAAKCSCFLTEEDNEIIANFMKAADNGSNTAVVSAATAASERIKRNLDKAKIDNEKNKKVRFSLWIYAGIFLVIILM